MSDGTVLSDEQLREAFYAPTFGGQSGAAEEMRRLRAVERAVLEAVGGQPNCEVADIERRWGSVTAEAFRRDYPEIARELQRVTNIAVDLKDALNSNTALRARVAELEDRLHTAESDLAHNRRERDEAMAEVARLKASPPPATPHEIPESVVLDCDRAYDSTPHALDAMRAALREYDRQMPALRGRVLDTALCCVSPQGRVIGVYQQRHFAEEAATVCGGTVHRVTLVEMEEGCEHG